MCHSISGKSGRVPADPAPAPAAPIETQRRVDPTPPAPTIEPLDIQRTAPARPAAPAPAPPKSAHIAQPVSRTPRDYFYQLATAAVTAEIIDFQKFNGLVDIASRQNYDAAILRLKAVPGVAALV